MGATFDKKEYSKRIVQRIKNIMNQKNISQSELIVLAEKEGYLLNQSSLSKMFSNSIANLNISSIVQIAHTLKIDLNDLLSMDSSINVRITDNNERQAGDTPELIVRADDKRMRPYMKTFYTYFFPTLSSDESILEGKLQFSPSNDNSKCLAHFSFKTGKFNQQNEPIEKKYDGELVLSPIMSSAYCTLKNEEIGEISYLLFSYMPILFESLRCRVALVLTSSAGASRVPTAHRMIISEERLSSEIMHTLQGQLFLNESEILISEADLEKFLEDEQLDKSFKAHFCKLEQGIKFEGLSPMPYYKFDESMIRRARLDPAVKTTAINLIRKYSASPRYNKIGTKCDEMVYKTIFEKGNT